MIIIDKVFFYSLMIGQQKEGTILPELRKPASVQAIYEDIKVLKSVEYQ